MGSLYAKDLIQIARDWIGYEEGDNNWNIFADVLDKCGYFSPQTKQNIAWCTIFCDFCALQAATPQDRANIEKKWDAMYFLYQTTPNYSARVKEFAQYFKDNGAFKTSDPKPGDMIIFNNYSHVGIIEDVDNGIITTIEGNAGNMVQRKWYDVDNSSITGYCSPRYDGFEAPSGNTTKEETRTYKADVKIKYVDGIPVHIDIDL